jgi:hypothetical protein
VENEHPKRPEWNIFMYKKVCGEIDTPQWVGLGAVGKVKCGVFVSASALAKHLF